MLRDLLYRGRALFQRKVVEDDLDAELQFHLDRLTEQHVRAGPAGPERDPTEGCVDHRSTT